MKMNGTITTEKGSMTAMADKCRCGNETAEEHTCPFAEDIFGDNTTLCTCCFECRHECLMDI